MNNAVFVIFVNFVAALGIVFANKWLFRSIHFPPVTLMAFHFLSTFIVLLALRLCGIFKVKRISVIRILPLRKFLKNTPYWKWCIFSVPQYRHRMATLKNFEIFESLSFCGSMVLTNLSLQHNTIGTYQVLKCLADPLFVFIQSVFYKKHYPLTVKLTLIPMILGITLNSWFDLRYSQIGTFYALSAVAITAVYTVVSYFWITMTVFITEFSGLEPSKRNSTCLQCKFYIIRPQLVLFYFWFWFPHTKRIRHSLSCSKTFQIFKCLCLSSAVLPRLQSI